MTEYDPTALPMQPPLPAEMAAAGAELTQINPMNLTTGELVAAMSEIGQRIQNREREIRALVAASQADKVALEVLRLVHEGKAAGSLQPGATPQHEITPDGRIMITGENRQVSRVIDAEPAVDLQPGMPAGPFPPQLEPPRWQAATTILPVQPATLPTGQEPPTFRGAIASIVNSTLEKLGPYSQSVVSDELIPPSRPPTAGELAHLYETRAAAARGQRPPAHAALMGETSRTDPDNEQLRERAARIGRAVAAVRYVRQAPDTEPAAPAEKPPVGRRSGEQTFVDEYRPEGAYDVFALARSAELQRAAELRRAIEAELAQATPNYEQIRTWEQQIAALERDEQATGGMEPTDQATLLRRVIKGLKDLPD